MKPTMNAFINVSNFSECYTYNFLFCMQFRGPYNSNPSSVSKSSFIIDTYFYFFDFFINTRSQF